MKASYELETPVFGMYFCGGKGFTIDNVEFLPNDEFWKKYLRNQYSFASARDLMEEHLLEQEHQCAGIACVRWLGFEEGLDKAVLITKEMLHDYSILLSFAHGHHVPFGTTLICYEGVGPNRKWSSTRGFMGRFGTPGIRPLNIVGSGIEAFLKNCFPLIRDSGFVERTQLKTAMIWYNQVECFESVFQTQFAFLWTALEILAGAYADCRNNLELQSANRIDEIRARFSRLLEEMNVQQIDSWVAKITKWTLAIDRAKELLKKYGLSQYEDELRPLYDLRNAIVHGRSVQVNKENIDKRFKLRKIIEKLILTMLQFYDRKDLIHSGITNENLLAVS